MLLDVVVVSGADVLDGVGAPNVVFAGGTLECVGAGASVLVGSGSVSYAAEFKLKDDAAVKILLICAAVAGGNSMYASFSLLWLHIFLGVVSVGVFDPELIDSLEVLFRLVRFRSSVDVSTIARPPFEDIGM